MKLYFTLLCRYAVPPYFIPRPRLKSALSGAPREEKDREKDGAARPSDCINKR